MKLNGVLPTEHRWRRTSGCLRRRASSLGPPPSPQLRSLDWCRISACRSAHTAFPLKKPSSFRCTSRPRVCKGARSGSMIAIATLRAGPRAAWVFTILSSVHGTVDPILHQLTQVILPSLSAPRAFSQLFLDYFRLLFCAHVAQKYAPSVETTSRPRGGLAPWQKRRVIDLCRQHLDGSLGLPTLAGVCGLSVSHFARAFRQSFGTPPHHYLVLQRVARAKAILSGSTPALAEVAQQAGFSDQASFSRTFKAIVGTTPGQWRRQQVINRHITCRR